MKRFILTAPPGPGGIIRLYDRDFHYLSRVRRLGPGSCFDAILPGGEETQIRVLSTVDNILIGECLGAGNVDAAPETQVPLPPIALFQGLPRGTKMDLIVRQAAECGVSIIVPFTAEYSAAQPKNQAGRPSPHKAGGEKIKRWERIIKEARQQSGSATETLVKPLPDFSALLEYWDILKKEYERPCAVLFHQEPLEKGTFHGYLGKSPDFVAMAVGPEGGFSPREVSLLMEAGFRPLLMGNTILRTETAALYGAAAIRIILLESESWMPRMTE